MSPLVVLFAFFLTCTVQTNLAFSHHRYLVDFPIQNDADKRNSAEANKKEEAAKVVVNVPNVQSNAEAKPVDLEHSKKPEQNKVITTKAPQKNATKVEEHGGIKANEMESGSLLRGVAVVVVLTMLVILYMGLKTYCGRKNKNPVMVSKYGVRTRRSDIEMTPLPLEEDEDDETVFEVRNTNR